jgi:hypothetical protein
MLLNVLSIWLSISKITSLHFGPKRKYNLQSYQVNLILYMVSGL